MNVRTLKATVKVGGGDVIYVGPFFTWKHDAIHRRMPSLLRATYFRGLMNENPVLVDQLIAVATVEISECNIYEAYCFASKRPDHARFFSASRHLRDLAALRSLLGSKDGPGWAYFIDLEVPNKRKASDEKE